MDMYVGSTVHKHIDSCRCFQKHFTSVQAQFGFLVVGEMKIHCLERYSFCIWNKRILQRSWLYSVVETSISFVTNVCLYLC